MLVALWDATSCSTFVQHLSSHLMLFLAGTKGGIQNP